MYLKLEAKRKRDTHEKQEYYLAQIAAVIQKNRAKEPAKVKLEDYLLTFPEPKEEPPECRAAKSKTAWLAAAGLKGVG